MVIIKDCKVSIIVPVYNREVLRRVLDSAMGHIHQNKKIIIINDGTTDGGSIEIIAEYQKRHSEIVVIATENRGLSCVLNTGIEHATGQYIIFPGSDDWIEIETLKKLLISLKNNNSDIVFFNATACADGMSESELRKFSYARSKDTKNQTVQCRPLFEEFISSRNYIASACLYLYRLSLFSDERFFPRIPHEDDLFTKLLIKKEDTTTVCLPDRFFRRRVRPEAIITQQKSIKHVKGYFSVAEELIKDELQNRSCPTAKALNLFAQGVIISTLTTVHAAFEGKISFHIRKKTLQLFFKKNLRHINSIAALICIFPEVIPLRRSLFCLLRRA